MANTVAATRLHLLEGSVGAEFISALLKVVLASVWISGGANRSSSLFSVLTDVPGGFWLLMTIGVVHLTAWTQPDTLPWLSVRKLCSSAGLAVWISLIYDLIGRGATATIVLLVPMALLMAVAIGRPHARL